MTEQKNDELPKSLEGVLGDIDITAELKRRLDSKRLTRNLDCECKDLTDAELLQAAKTSHDLRTGKIDPSDIESHLAIHPTLV